MPKTSYYKLIDWWLLSCSNLLVFTLGFHTYLAYVVRQLKEETGSNKGKNPKLEAEIHPGTLVLTKHGMPSSNVIKVSPMYGNENDKDKMATMERPIWLNKLAKIVFIIFLVLFNVMFWIIALDEHFESSDEIISNHLHI